jgi:Big-like domain-containing protein
VPDPPVVQLRISPDVATLESGQATQFVVTSTPARPDLPVRWATSNDAVATVSDMGVVTGVAAGRATIMVTSDGATVTSIVTVTAPPSQPPPGNQLLWVTPQAVTIEPWMTTRLGVGSSVWSEPFPKTWTSSDPAVAIVNQYGAVTGVATGRATITVTNEGASARSEVTVAEGPSGGPAWPNEPAGLMLISDYGFDDPLPFGSDVPVGSRGWAIQNGGGNATLVSDPTVPEGSPNVMQYRYPMGMRDGIGPAVMYRQTGGHELYVGFWWKASQPFHPHSSGVNKIAFTWSKGQSLSYINMQGTREPYSITIHDAPLGNAQTLFPNVTTSPVMLGVWHRIELYEKYSTTASSNDGIVRWWVDGVLNGNYTNLNYVQDAGWGEFQFATTFGGNTGETKGGDDYYWFDRVRLSASRH